MSQEKNNNKLHLKPLSTKETKEKAAIKESYCDFWNNVKFLKGWAEPRFTRQEVDHLLDLVAEIVTRIRHDLDEKSPGFKLRMKSGNANEFLWSIDYNPNEFPANFVSDMVHHTLQDANGYVEGLTFEKVEQYVAQINNYVKEERAILENGPKLQGFIQESVQELQEEVKKLLALDVFSVEKLSFEKSTALKKFLHELQDVKEEIRELEAVEREEKAAAERLQKEKEKREREEKEKAEREAAEKEKERKERQERERQEKERQEQERKAKEEKAKASTDGDDLSSSQVGLNKIKIVAQDVSRIGNEVRTLKNTTEHLKFEELASNPAASSRLLEDFKKKCSFYSASLMNDLLTLDQVAGGQTTRQARKDQVNSIQAMLDEIDAVNNKLQGLAQLIQEKEKTEQPKAQPKAPEHQEKPKQEEKKQPAAAPAPKSGEEDERVGQLARSTHQLDELRKKDRKASILQDKWKQMKLKSKFDVQETKDAFVLVSYIPGLKNEEIQISFSRADRTITIEGVRAPSLEEENAMKQKLKVLIENEYGQVDVPEEELDTLLLKFAMGRYGRFSETFRVPKNADLEGITADYQRGMLQVVVPKVFSPPPVHRPKPPVRSPFLGSSQFTPHMFYPGALQSPPPSGQPFDFFDDRDYWW